MVAHPPGAARAGDGRCGTLVGAMNIDYAFFADTATVPPDGKVYVHGGGFSAVSVPSLPARIAFAVVAGFRFGAEDANATHHVQLRLLDADDRLVVPPVDLQFQSAGPPPVPGREVTVPTVSYLQPMFGEPGTYAASYWSGDQQLFRVPLYVEEQLQPAVGPLPN
ncbi:MAG: hypothetical protein ABR541_01560 [Candidatus Dormibacteria bacterium]